jgi:hypothetical protein
LFLATSVPTDGAKTFILVAGNSRSFWPKKAGRKVKKHGLLLVGSNAHRMASEKSSLKRIEKHGFVAEIRSSFSPALDAEIFHYIVQRKGSKEIIHWGQEVSFDRALDCVNDFIKDQRRISAVM